MARPRLGEEERRGRTVGVRVTEAEAEELRDFPGDELGSVIQNQRPVEIPGVIDAILDFDAVSIELSMLGTVAFHVTIDMDLDDLVGGKKAVADALFQGVRVNGLTEVMDVRDVLGFLGRGRETNLRGRREVLENLPPGRIPRQHCRDGTRRSR